jgi:hypothetical protein
MMDDQPNSANHRSGEDSRFNHSIISLPAVIVFIFIAWAIFYIYHISGIGIDGKRYYSLFDDAMIMMRYAWNLVHGSGLVWNPGENIEGYTSLLMVLIMSPFNAAFADKRWAVLSIHLLGVITMVAISLASRFVFRQVSERIPYPLRKWAEPLLLLGILFYYPLMFFSLMGMETGILTLLLLCAVGFCLRALDHYSPNNVYAVAFLLGLAFLTRPDSLIFALPILAVLFIEGLRKRNTDRNLTHLAAAATLFVSIIGSQIIFRWAYYGTLVPNTYALKIEGFPLALRIKNGLAYLKPFATEFAPLWALSIAGTVIAPSRKRVLIVSLFLAAVTYTVYSGGDAWRIWRWIVPTVPLIMCIALEDISLVAVALGHLLEKIKSLQTWALNAGQRNLIRGLHLLPRSLKREVWALITGVATIFVAFVVDPLGLSDPGIGEEQKVLLVLGIAFLFVGILLISRRLVPRHSPIALLFFVVIWAVVIGVINQRFWPVITFRVRPDDADFNLANLNVAIALNNSTKDTAVIGVKNAGTIPYYTGRIAVDFLGKVDAYIAHLPADVSGGVARGSMLTWPGHNKYDLEYSIDILRPTYVQTLQWGQDNLLNLLGDIYVSSTYLGVRLYFLRESPDVLWDRVTIEP